MKLFERTGGHWIFYISAVYFIVGIASLYRGEPSILLSPLYVIFLAMPFWFPPLGRAINLDVDWDRKMFDFFRFKKNVEGTETTNVVPFPEPKPTPYIVPPTPEKEEPAKIFYRLGVTDKNRISFQMGYSEITMNKEGIDNMIRQLAVFRDQLQDEPSNDNE